jgi:peptide/nickel transport system ATP-binding protein
MMADSKFLEIAGLSVSYSMPRGRVQAVSNLSMSVPAGAAVGLVGESGCGKTTLIKALMRLLPPNGRIDQGQILFNGRDLTRLSDAELRQVRWREIALVPQSAMNSLNPVHRVGDPLVETMMVREGMSREAAWARAGELFEMVGIEPKRLRDYPHQFSGGMKQRAVIALAMVLSPKLIIADEPTTALDVLVEARILDLLGRLEKERGLTLIYITHNLSVVARTCNLTGVIYAGELVEYGPTARLINEPRHPYTMGLIASIPKGHVKQWNPVSIPGAPPDLLTPPVGCRFKERCPFATAVCDKHPELRPADANHLVACHHADQASRLWPQAQSPETWKCSSAGMREAA